MKKILFLFVIIINLFACKKVDNIEKLDNPVINYFYNDADTIGATLTIIGLNFSKVNKNNIVVFNATEATPYYSSNDTLMVIIPENATTGLIAVQVYSKSDTSKNIFYVVTGRWHQKTSIPIGRFEAVGFSLGNNGYIGTGTGYSDYLQDFWGFDPLKDTWTKKSNFQGGLRREAVSFVISGKAYVGCGTNTQTFSEANDFYEYDSSGETWVRKADPGIYLDNAVGLSINGKGYIITGDYSNEVLEYNPQNNIWTKKKDFPGVSRSSASGFVIGNKGYIFGGNSGGSPDLRDLWEYDPVYDEWSRKADLNGIFRGYEAVGFSLNGKGYVGNSNGSFKQFWEYNPLTNTWIRKTNFPSNSLGYSSSFVINNKAYVVGGVISNDVSNEVWEFVP